MFAPVIPSVLGIASAARGVEGPDPDPIRDVGDAEPARATGESRLSAAMLTGSTPRTVARARVGRRREEEPRAPGLAVARTSGERGRREPHFASSQMARRRRHRVWQRRSLLIPVYFRSRCARCRCPAGVGLGSFRRHRLRSARTLGGVRPQAAPASQARARGMPLARGV